MVLDDLYISDEEINNLVVGYMTHCEYEDGDEVPLERHYWNIETDIRAKFRRVRTSPIGHGKNIATYEATEVFS